MKKKAWTLLLSILLLIIVLPVSAYAENTAGSWNVKLDIRNNSNVKYEQRDTIELQLKIQSDSLNVAHVAGVGFVADLNVFDLVYDDAAGVANQYTSYLTKDLKPYEYAAFSKYETGKGPEAIRWDANVYIARNEALNQAYVLFQPYAFVPTQCKQEICLASMLLGLKPGKTQADITADSIRWMTAEEAAAANQSCVIEITDGNANTQNWRFTEQGKADTLLTVPVVEWNLIQEPENKIVIVEQPKNQEAAENTVASFHVKAEGKNLAYQWEYADPGSDTWGKCFLGGNNTDTLTVTAKEYRDGMRFRCVVSSGELSEISQPAKLTLKKRAVAPKITGQPKDQQAELNVKVQFHVTATGSDLKYQWEYANPGSDTWGKCYLSGNNTDTLRVTVTEYRHGMRFRCRVSNEAKYVMSEPATLLMK